MRRINADQSTLDSLTNILSTCFVTDEKVVDLFEVERGVNAQNLHCHFVAKTDAGYFYGFKSNPRVGHGGEEREKLISELASLLDAPHVCKAELTQSVSCIPQLAGRTVVVIKWLPCAFALDELKADQINALKGNAKLLYQLGEWTFFVLAFGLSDKHLGNWTWSFDIERLCIIDNESCFEPAPIQHFSNILALFSDLARLKSDQGFEDRQEFERGVIEMRKKMLQRIGQIEKLLDEYSLRSNWKKDWVNMSEVEAVVAILKQL